MERKKKFSVERDVKNCVIELKRKFYKDPIWKNCKVLQSRDKVLQLIFIVVIMYD